MFKIHYFKKLDSTNLKAKIIAIPGSVIVSEEQIKGKGRFDRSWSSSRGGLYFSLILRIEDIEKLPYLTFIAAISTQKAIKNVCGLKTIIKWPNDLIYNKKKLCGILTETIIGKKKLAIVGIGINTNNRIPLSLKKKVASLNTILGKQMDNKKLLTEILKNFEKYYLILKNKNYNKIISEWKKNSFLGSDITIKTIGKKYSGVAYDVDKHCFLIVKDKKGKKIVVKEGDIFVK